MVNSNDSWCSNFTLYIQVSTFNCSRCACKLHSTVNSLKLVSWFSADQYFRTASNSTSSCHGGVCPSGAFAFPQWWQSRANWPHWKQDLCPDRWDIQCSSMLEYCSIDLLGCAGTAAIHDLNNMQVAGNKECLRTLCSVDVYVKGNPINYMWEFLRHTEVLWMRHLVRNVIINAFLSHSHLDLLWIRLSETISF